MEYRFVKSDRKCRSGVAGPAVRRQVSSKHLYEMKTNSHMATKRRYCCPDNKSAVVGGSAASAAIGMASVTADKYEETAENLQPVPR